MMKQIENDEATAVLPQPCNGPLYDKATLGDHLGKVFEELCELSEAVAQYTNDPDSVKNYDHMCLEATDGITALTTLLEYVKCDESMRQEYQRRVNHSNAVRDGGQEGEKMSNFARKARRKNLKTFKRDVDYSVQCRHESESGGPARDNRADYPRSQCGVRDVRQSDDDIRRGGTQVHSAGARK
jgi:hypothetical protein